MPRESPSPPHNMTNDGGISAACTPKVHGKFTGKTIKKHISKTPFAINDDNWSNIAATRHIKKKYVKTAMPKWKKKRNEKKTHVKRSKKYRNENG